MDKLLRELQRQARLHPNDAETQQQYIHALERMIGVADNEETKPFQLYLVSGEGARHEDRLPVAIFTSQGAALAALRKSVARVEAAESDYTIDVGMQTYDGDYGPLTELYGSASPEAGWGFSYLIEGFQLNPEDLGPIF